MGLHLITRAGLTLMSTIALISAMVDIAMGDSNKDREECAEQLVGLATCLPYVGGNAKAPTPDCCNGLKQVLKDNKKCLCVIIRDRNDPELGLKINVTLALGLPSVCHATANVSQCPALLHMDPNSPDAQVFYQFAKSSNTSSPAPSPTEEGNPTSGSSQGQSAQKISYGGNSKSRKGKSRLEIFSLGLGLSLWYFFYVQLFI